MRSMLHVGFAAAVALSGMSTGLAQTSNHRMLSPDDLQWSDVASLPPGAKISVIEGPMSEAVPFTVRLKFPPNYQIPPHWHPVMERVTVISGTFHMGIGEQFDRQKTMALTSGGMMIMQPKTPHFAWTQEEAIVQLHGTGPWGVTFVNPADDPRKK